jgi:hypothetical protein
MDEEQTWRYRRWHEADQTGRDDEADAACRALFAAAVAAPRVAPEFAARTAAAVAAGRARDVALARRVRRVTVGLSVAATAAAVYAGGPWMLSMLSAVVAGAIDLLVALAVRIATGMETGGDVWTVVAGLGRAAAALVSNPAVTIAMLAMQGIAMVGLIALHRLLGPERESLK